MNFLLLKKNQAQPTSGLPINLMVEALGAIEDFLKSENKPSTSEHVMGTGTLVLVEGATSWLSQTNALALPLKKHMLVNLRRGQNGEAYFSDGNVLNLGVTPVGEFVQSKTPFNAEVFESRGKGLLPNSARAQVVDWIENGERGLSSEAMCAHLGERAGVNEARFLQVRENDKAAHPRDPSDFKRCALLLEKVPSFKDALFEMKALSPEWNVLVDAWPALDALYQEEGNQKKAPKLFAEMQRVLMSVKLQPSAHTTPAPTV